MEKFRFIPERKEKKLEFMEFFTLKNSELSRFGLNYLETVDDLELSP